MLAGLTEWLDAYGRALEARDAEALAGLFTDDAVCHWQPFDNRLHGRPVIRAAWEEAVEGRERLSFGYEVLAATQRGGIVRWWSTVDDLRLEGIFKLVFDEAGLCKTLQAWWNADA